MAGKVIAGRYEIGERLGVGGMSTVQRALDRRLERHVAVKLLAEHLADDEQFVSRFRREALAAARLVHPNIVQVFDFGLDDASGRHYIVMELIQGHSGAELLREEGRLGQKEALHIVTQSCRGLDYAHRNGVVHRDVKPGNLLRSNDGVVKLADFGIAKAVSDDSAITQVGSVLGTASYLAPEQARGEEAAAPADIYALGVVTYQLLSGRLPYEAGSLTELALKQQQEAPAWLHEVDPTIPEPLSIAIDKALALDVEERYATADEFRRALEDGVRGKAPETTSATRVAGPATEATRMVPAQPRRQRTSDQAAVVAAGPRQPRAPRQAPPVAAPAPVAQQAAGGVPVKRGGGAKRALGYFLVLLVLAAAGAAYVVGTSGDADAVRVREVTGETVDDLVSSMQSLIENNTR